MTTNTKASKTTPRKPAAKGPRDFQRSGGGVCRTAAGFSPARFRNSLRADKRAFDLAAKGMTQREIAKKLQLRSDGAAGD